jgi:hypothetical protein
MSSNVSRGGPPFLAVAVAVLATLAGVPRAGEAQQPQRIFQPTVQVLWPSGVSVPFTVNMPTELAADVSRFRELTVRYRIEKYNVASATATTIKMQTAMSTQDETEWQSIGTGVSLTGSSTSPSISSETISVTSSQVLMRNVRWQVSFNGTYPSGTGAVTFSIDLVGHP